MLKCGRILVGLNGDASDEYVIRYAAMVARLGRSGEECSDRPTFQHVRSLTDAIITTTAPSTTARSTSSRRKAMKSLPEIRFVSLLANKDYANASPRNILTAHVERHFQSLPRPVQTSIDLLKGRPLERLPSLAYDFDCELLLLDEAVGTNSHRARLVVAAPCPVWLVPPGWAPVLRRILVPIDFTTRAAVSMRTAIELARCFRPAKCLAVYVEPQQSRFAGDGIGPVRRRELNDEFATFMKAIDARDVEVEPHFVNDEHFGRAIERVARKHATDLTVLSARRRSRLVSAIHPGQAELAIRHGIGPVLVLKASDRPIGTFEALTRRCRNTPTPHFS
jgi:nucleotide-binding universal stress UspA family protein